MKGATTRYQRTPAEHRLLRAIATMPYGAGIPADVGLDEYRDARPITIDDFATYAEALREHLQINAGIQQRTDAELSRYRNAVAGLRDLVGLVTAADAR